MCIATQPLATTPRPMGVHMGQQQTATCTPPSPLPWSMQHTMKVAAPEAPPRSSTMRVAAHYHISGACTCGARQARVPSATHNASHASGMIYANPCRKHTYIRCMTLAIVTRWCVPYAIYNACANRAKGLYAVACTHRLYDCDSCTYNAHGALTHRVARQHTMYQPQHMMLQLYGYACYDGCEQLIVAYGRTTRVRMPQTNWPRPSAQSRPGFAHNRMKDGVRARSAIAEQMRTPESVHPCDGRMCERSIYRRAWAARNG